MPQGLTAIKQQYHHRYDCINGGTFFGGEQGIRTLERFIAVTRFPKDKAEICVARLGSRKSYFLTFFSNDGKLQKPRILGKYWRFCSSSFRRRKW